MNRNSFSMETSQSQFKWIGMMVRQMYIIKYYIIFLHFIQVLLCFMNVQNFIEIF